MEVKTKKIILISSFIALYILVIVLFFLGGLTSVLDEFTQICALLGLLSLILSSIMSIFTRDIYKIFGKPFKTLHHYIALFGLGSIILHPVFAAINARDALVFVPKLPFWILAGRPALYLIIIAVLAGFLQNKLGKWWRYIHILNYIAVVFGVIHGLLIGSNLSISIALKIIYIILLIAVATAFVVKRYQMFTKKKRLKERMEKKAEKTEEV